MSKITTTSLNDLSQQRG